jgi:hypothetical protein
MSDSSTANLVCLCELNCFVHLLVLKFQKKKHHFRKFLTNSVTTDGVQAATASIQSNNDSQDLEELLPSIEPENTMLVQSPDLHEELFLATEAENSLLVRSPDLHDELMLSLEDENSMLVQATSNYTPPMSPQQRVSLEQSAG